MQDQIPWSSPRWRRPSGHRCTAMAKEPHVYSFFQQRGWRCGGVSSSLWREVNVQKRRPEVCMRCKCARCSSESGKNTGSYVHMPLLHPTSPPFKVRGVLRFLYLHFPTSQLESSVIISRNWIFEIENNSDPHLPTLNKMNPISLSCFTSRKTKYYPKLWAQRCWHSQLLKTQVPKPSALCWVGNSFAIPSSTPNPLSPSLNFKI